MWNRDVRELKSLWRFIIILCVCSLLLLLFIAAQIFGWGGALVTLLVVFVFVRHCQSITPESRWERSDRRRRDDDFGGEAPDAGARVPVSPRTPHRPVLVREELPVEH